MRLPESKAGLSHSPSQLRGSAHCPFALPVQDEEETGWRVASSWRQHGISLENVSQDDQRTTNERFGVDVDLPSQNHFGDVNRLSQSSQGAVGGHETEVWGWGVEERGVDAFKMKWKLNVKVYVIEHFGPCLLFA